LAWELFSSNYLAFARELERLQAEYDSLRDKLAAMIRLFCAFFDRDPVLFSYLLLAQHTQLKKVTPEMVTAVPQRSLPRGWPAGKCGDGRGTGAAMVMGWCSGRGLPGLRPHHPDMSRW
jgi:hypothetical protein